MIFPPTPEIVGRHTTGKQRLQVVCEAGSQLFSLHTRMFSLKYRDLLSPSTLAFLLQEHNDEGTDPL